MESGRIHVDRYSRQPEGDWLIHSAGAQETIELASAGCHLDISGLYEKVDF